MMRISSILQLAIAAIVMNSVVVHSEQTSILKTNVLESRLLKASSNVQVATRRLLRSQEVGDDEQDDGYDDSSERVLLGIDKLAVVESRTTGVVSERALTDIDKLTKLVSRFSNSQPLSNKLWLWASKSPNKVFKNLKLHNAGEETKQLLQWLSYVQAYQKKMNSGTRAFYDYQVYFKLTDTKLSEVNVAILLQLLKESPEFETFARKVQRAQFDSWLNTKNYVPIDIENILGDSSSDLVFQILTEYASFIAVASK